MNSSKIKNIISKSIIYIITFVLSHWNIILFDI